MSKRSDEPTLNPEQVQRLVDFAAEHGRTWKSELNAMWYDGRDANERDGHLLRQVRNTISPSGLIKFKLPKTKPIAVEAYGVKGFQNLSWRKTFKSTDAMNEWVEQNDAEILGTRDASAPAVRS